MGYFGAGLHAPALPVHSFDSVAAGGAHPVANARLIHVHSEDALRVRTLLLCVIVPLPRSQRLRLVLCACGDARYVGQGRRGPEHVGASPCFDRGYHSWQGSNAECMRCRCRVCHNMVDYRLHVVLTVGAFVRFSWSSMGSVASRCPILTCQRRRHLAAHDLCDERLVSRSSPSGATDASVIAL